MATVPLRHIEAALIGLRDEIKRRGITDCTAGHDKELLYIYVGNGGHYEILWNEFHNKPYNGFKVKVLYTGKFFIDVLNGARTF